MQVIEGSGGIKIHYYANPKELPAGRFKDFQKYMFEDWGVGTDMKAIDARLSTAFNMIQQDMKDKALQELYNLRMAANYILNKLSIKSYAFAVLIGKINDDVCTDYSEDGLKAIIEKIEGNLTQQQIETVAEAVKKNLNLP